MTTDQPQPYSAAELPCVIDELWENHKRWAGSRHRDIVAMVQICGRVPRLLASFEALAADAERYRWLKQSSWTVKRYVPAVYQDVTVSKDLDAEIDAARAAQKPE